MRMHDISKVGVVDLTLAHELLSLFGWSFDEEKRAGC